MPKTVRPAKTKRISGKEEIKISPILTQIADIKVGTDIFMWA